MTWYLLLALTLWSAVQTTGRYAVGQVTVLRPIVHTSKTAALVQDLKPVFSCNSQIENRARIRIDNHVQFTVINFRTGEQDAHPIDLHDSLGSCRARAGRCSKNVPPEQRRMVEQMMKGKIPEAMGSGKLGGEATTFRP